MKLHPFVLPAAAGLALSLALAPPLTCQAQPGQVITLEPPTGLDLQAHTYSGSGALLPAAPANFRRLGEARAGEPADLRTLTLRFSQTTRITAISISKDFRIEQGGSCVEGNIYAKGDACRLLVRFTPQGPGNRLGKLTVSHTASPTPDAFGLGGTGYMPVVNFIPSLITTVPGTYPNNSGLINGATDLAVDGGDTLYVADTNNSAIRMMDSSGKFLTISASDALAPMGVAADSFGEVFYSEPNSNAIYEIFANGTAHIRASGAGTAEACTDASSPCQLADEQVYMPGHISIIPGDTMFFNENGIANRGVAISQIHPEPTTFARLFNPFAYRASPMSALSADQYSNIFTAYDGVGIGLCEIVMQTLSDAENARRAWQKVAGGRNCGFSGDGGLARNAEINTTVGQIAFDAAGDLYFTDTDNQRVRRIDYNTGIIRTIAGNGIAGYSGDTGPATTARLANPAGVAVDSLGQVYILSGATAADPAQVVRLVGTTGYVWMGHVIRGLKSSAFPVIVTNTGNSALSIANSMFTGPNASNFAVDPATTSCLLAPGSALASGQSCQIGFVFTPSAAGAASATFIILDNTAKFSNTVKLSGVGDLPPAAFKITAPANGANESIGVSFPFSVSVTSTSGPAPTGTVQFMVKVANYGSPVNISSGVASTNITLNGAGPQTLSATYSGDSNYSAAGPVSVSVTVQGSKSASQVSLVPGLSASATCLPSSYWATVTSNTGVPTGSVQLLNGNTVLASNKLSNGRVLLAPRRLPAGRYSLTARYSGDAHFAPAVSAVLNERISTQPGCGQDLGGPVPFGPRKMQ